MTAAIDGLDSPPRALPYDILRAAYAELDVTDLSASTHFYGDLLGLFVSDRTDDTVYLRGWEERHHHSLVLRQAKRPSVVRLGFRVRAEDHLDALSEDLGQRSLDCQWLEGPSLGIGRALRTWDPFGYPIEFYFAMEQCETLLQRFDLQRGAPLLRLDHFNLHTPRLEEAFNFWTGLGFRCSEYISTDEPGERITAAWLMRKPSVHDIALTAGRGPRLHHFAYWVAEPSGILRTLDQLAAAGHPAAIERGPGRHGVSNAFFVYLRDPDGHRIELYSCDYYTGDPDHPPLRWSVSDPRCRSFWGASTPDSWYEESSEVRGPDGAPVPTTAADIDERDAHSEVLA